MIGGLLPDGPCCSMLRGMVAHAARSRWKMTRDALTDRNLRRLLLAVSSWSATEKSFLLAASILALDLGGPAAVGLVGALRMLPAAFTASLMSTVADRVPRPLIVTGVNAVFVGVSLAAAVTAFSGAALPVLLIVVGLASLVSALLKPSMQAMLPQLVRSPEQLLRANAAWSVFNGVGGVAGPATAAILLSQLGVGAVFLALAVAYALTALTTRTIRTDFQPARATASRGRARLMAPLRGMALFSGRGTRAMFTLLMLTLAMNGFLSVAIILRAVELVGEGSTAQVLAGSLVTAHGIGSFIGALLTWSVAASHGVRWFAFGTCLYGLAVAAMGAVVGTTLTWLCLLVAGAGFAMLWTFGANLVSRLLPDHLAGRGWGAINGIGAVAYALGSLSAPLLADQLSLSVALVAAGCVVAVGPMLGWFALRVVHQKTTPDDGDVQLLSALPVFAALPAVAVCRIACTAESRRFAAGHAVVLEGAPGEEFFIVRSGELAVTQADIEVRRLSPGQSFGEIALLRTVPRTATVLAITDVELLCVGQELFVASITGHRSTDVDAHVKVTALLDEDKRRSQA